MWRFPNLTGANRFMIAYNPKDWSSHLFDIRGSMVQEIFGRVVVSVIWATIVMLAYEWGCTWLAVQPTMHTIMATALGLLLVMRTNSSYDRFWEGRRMWGAIVNETRNLGRGCAVFLPQDRQLAARAIDWTVAFSYASMHSLRGERQIGPVASRLPVEEVTQVLDANHVPLAVAIKISETLRTARDRGYISDYLLAMIDQNTQLLMDYIGACERIHRTPLPFAYMVHLRRALLIFCYTLPFALVQTFEWATVVVCFLVSYVFLGIEEIGVEIEDPFGCDANDLPLEQFCATVERGLQDLIAPTAASESH